MSHCCLCGGKTKLDRVRAENWWGDTLAFVENVPAWVCEDCGEPYFEAATCRELDRLRQAPPPARKTIQVPVYAFSDEAA
jgi:YgiT-type zinc finger domain-containing protein